MSIKTSNAVKVYEARINRVLHYINENLESDLSLSVLSKEAFFSPFHFHRVFLSLLGETPNDFVKRLRVEKAANLLITYRDMPVTEIAFNCGFSSSATFARAFKEHFNYSASEWRSGGYEVYSQENRNSKNCKTESNNSKALLENREYLLSVDNLIQSNNLWSKDMKVEIKKMPALHLAYVSHNQGYNSKVGAAFDKLCKWAWPRGLITKDSVFLGISLDNPDITPPDKCRYYASMTVPQNTEVSNGIGLTDIPEFTCAVYRYEGTQDGIEAAYNDVYRNWLPQSGYQPEDFPCYEIYLKSPNDKPKGVFIMDVCIPVRPL
ncbi:MAG: AraC family transcriptional regulator [Bacillota bacterium]